MKVFKKIESRETFWFTLVELLIVIVIISILSALWFVFYEGYLVTARDANRISAINQSISKLQTHWISNRYSIPEGAITITASGSTIAYQGLYNKDIQEWIGATGVYDPLDDAFFTYNVSPSLKKVQLTTYLEGRDNARFDAFSLSSPLEKYAGRIPHTIWDKIGMLYDTISLLPIHEIDSVIAAWTLDISLSSSNYSVYLPIDVMYTWSGGSVVAHINTKPVSLLANNPPVGWTWSGWTWNASCSLPWGWTLSDGANVAAYSAASVPFGWNCSSVAQTRACSNGVLSGTFSNQNCTVQAPVFWAQAPFTNWNGTSSINTIGNPASNTFNVFNPYFASIATIIIWDQSATINGNHFNIRNITVWNGNNLIRVWSSANVILVWNGDNRIEKSGAGGGSSIELWSGNNTVISTWGDAITTWISGSNLSYSKGSSVTNTTFIWRGWDVLIDRFRGSGSDVINFSQKADITDYTDLISDHLLPWVPSGGFTVQSTSWNIVVQNLVFTLNSSNFSF